MITFTRKVSGIAKFHHRRYDNFTRWYKFNRNVQLSITFKTNSESSVIQSLDKLAINKPVADLQMCMKGK